MPPVIARSLPSLAEKKITAEFILIPALCCDFVYLILRPILQYVAPVAFVTTAFLLYVVAFLDMDKDTSAVSNAATAMLVAVASLAFTWASAIGKDDKDFEMVMRMSLRLLSAVVSFILATGFKYALLKLNLYEALPLQGKSVRLILFIIMAGLFAQAMMDAILPLLRINAYLVSKNTFLPGFTLMRDRLPTLYRWFHSRFKVERDVPTREGANGAATDG